MTSVVLIVAVTVLTVIGVIVRVLGYGSFERARARRLRRRR